MLTGHGGAATFHAEDIMEVFMRMTGEAMGVSPEHLSAFHVLATIRRFEHGRRVTSLTGWYGYGHTPTQPRAR